MQNFQYTIKKISRLSYQEQEKSQLKWGKEINSNQHQDKSDVGIIWQDFTATIRKRASVNNHNFSENKCKNRKPQEKINL